MTPIVRIALQAGSLLASGWLLRGPESVTVWQIGLALLLGTGAVVWMYLHEE
jgi:hypothetical protein